MPLARILGRTIGKVNAKWLPDSGQFDQNRNIELRIIFLHVLRPVLLPELFDHGLESLRISYGGGPEFRFHASRINPNRRVLQHISVPLGVGAAHWEQVQLLTFQHEPHGHGDHLPGFPSRDAELDLAVAGESVFESFL